MASIQKLKIKTLEGMAESEEGASEHQRTGKWETDQRTTDDCALGLTSCWVGRIEIP